MQTVDLQPSLSQSEAAPMGLRQVHNGLTDCAGGKDEAGKDTYLLNFLKG